MARSYRKTPISGITKKDSDKQYKTAEHKRARRAAKALNLSDEEPPSEKAFGNPWGAPNDVKRWYDPKRLPEITRK